MSDDFSEMDALYGSDPEFPDVRHETVDALRAEIERLRAALEAIIADAPIEEPEVGYVQHLSLVALGERRGRWQAAQMAREALKMLD